MDTTPHADEDTGRPSRSQQRRDAKAMLALAEKLLSLPPARLDKLTLPEDVREAMDDTRRIRSHIARKRQMAYLAKLMRRHGEEAFADAQAAIGNDRMRHRKEAAALKHAEVLRERLVEGDNNALTELIDDHPDIDRQHLNALVRQTRSERKRDKPPRAGRELFRLLRTLFDN